MPTEIKERDAVEQLVKYLRREADIDDIAQIWSDRLGDDIVRVVSADDNSLKSDAYLNGDRVVGPKPPLVLSEEQRNAYLNNKGQRCPFCKSTDIEAEDPPEMDGNIACQIVSCTDCGGKWEDQYTLNDVELKEAPEKAHADEE